MSLHLFAAFITPHGVAANNRGENEGCTTTLQKLVWKGQPHSTVSAEAIRFALRRRLEEAEPGSCNRIFDDDAHVNKWKDAKFAGWSDKDNKVFTDDDLLGFMKAEGGKAENEKGSTISRRAVLEITRAVSLTPWHGDVTFNAASPGATASAAKHDDEKRSNPVPYGTEMHATRYQYGIALTPDRLRDPVRAELAIKALCALGGVAGNHARFLFDFSPESVVFRITHDPAPRLLYCFEDHGGKITFPHLLDLIRAGDVETKELVIGGSIVVKMGDPEKKMLSGAKLIAGIKAAADEACSRTNAR